MNLNPTSLNSAVPETNQTNHEIDHDTTHISQTNIGSDFDQSRGQIIFGSTSTTYNDIRLGWIPDAKHGYSLILSTMITQRGSPFILGTLSKQLEEVTLSAMLRTKRFNIPILVYGHNSFDKTVETMCNILLNRGFTHVFVYIGGMFEWLLLNKLYGNNACPIKCTCCNTPTCWAKPDPLKFSPVVDRIVEIEI